MSACDIFPVFLLHLPENKTEYHASIQDPICNQIQVRPPIPALSHPDMEWNPRQKGGSQGFFPLSPDSGYG